jgi:hypothetical protein
VEISVMTLDPTHLRKLAAEAFADDYEKPWKAKYENDVGPNDDDFWEWWQLGSARVSDPAHAEFMEAVCNSIIPLLDELERKTKELKRISELPMRKANGSDTDNVSLDTYTGGKAILIARAALEGK